MLVPSISQRLLFREPRRRAWAQRGAAWLVLLALVLGASVAAAAPGDTSQFPINEDDPSASIPSEEARNAAPLEFGNYLQDMYTRAQTAFEAKEWQKSAKYFEALALTLPDRAFSFNMLCQVYENLGKIEIASANCAKALQLGGVALADHARFVRVTLRKPALSATDVADIDASIAHVRSHVAALPPEAPLPPLPKAAPLPSGRKPTGAEIQADFGRLKEQAELRREAEKVAQQRASFLMDLNLLACRLGVRLRDPAHLASCVDELRTLKADERVVLTFEWSRAVSMKDHARASTLVEKARTLGIPAATLQAMLAEQEKAFALTGTRAFFNRFGASLLIGVCAFALASFGALRFRALRRKLQPANQQP